ncbi:MAG TPA: dynamin family protein [Chitinispirillaceae bacterium]|nr:dynamin family protein [Chitinispirillaceae bacterium]
MINRDSLPNTSDLPVSFSQNEPLSIDQIIDNALKQCNNLPESCSPFITQIMELKNRLSYGRLHLAILGQFNRGKSTFINALTGFRILPTSVLPITSVPTFITYANNLSCTVKFLNNNPDLVITHSVEAISSTLIRYVAEENNPKNELCVRNVEVNCPSPLLENGTVLIDTPGFGSTYIHNTRSALDALSECDAAIFLVSADPPMTQTEIEFLKQVNKHVPRIFFILNKIDLLDNLELDKIEQFIREILVKQLDYPLNIPLFRICALNGEKALKQDKTDFNWTNSGMEKVREEIFDFLIREKYFTLSQGLNDKLEDALRGICTCLQKEIDNHQIPVQLLISEKQELLNQFDSIRISIDKDISLINIEKEAIQKFLKEQISSEQKIIIGHLADILVSLLTNVSGNQESIYSIAKALNRITNDNLSNTLTVLINKVNKPLRKAIQFHLHEFDRIFETFNKAVHDPEINAIEFHDKIENMEISTERTWQPENALSELSLERRWTDRFRNRQSRIARLQQYFTEKIKGIVLKNTETLEEHLELEIKSAFDKISDTLSERYDKFSIFLDEAVKKKEIAIKERMEKGGKPAAKLKESITAISNIQKLLT